ncbi:vitamin K epoxide reductase family protein [Streptomyces viridosporus]|uniref:vitamin K epoxide reductase family protein n=1 Tax=Streptomyces viridosporus TaxID=67581 RepID=UPI001359D084|nr:vitamin K epoxide reductase family protein [Streptomyces viridosporus]
MGRWSRRAAPLIGRGAFAAVAAPGPTVPAGARLHRGLWLALDAGAPAAAGLVHWLIRQSPYDLGRLCPSCVVVWIVAVALFRYVTPRDLRHGVPGPGGRSRAAPAPPWTWCRGTTGSPWPAGTASSSRSS